MPLRGSGLFRDGSILTLFSKYDWYRRTGYSHAEAAIKARWRAGLLPTTPAAQPHAGVLTAISARGPRAHTR